MGRGRKKIDPELILDAGHRVVKRGQSPSLENIAAESGTSQSTVQAIRKALRQEKPSRWPWKNVESSAQGRRTRFAEKFNPMGFPSGSGKRSQTGSEGPLWLKMYYQRHPERRRGDTAKKHQNLDEYLTISHYQLTGEVLTAKRSKTG